MASLEDIGVYVVALRMIDKQGWASAAELDGESRGLTPELVLGSIERLIAHGLLLPLEESEHLQALPSWARPAAEVYLTATVGTEHLQDRITAVFAADGDPEAHTLQTLNDATVKLQLTRDELKAWQHALEDLHDGLLAAPDGETTPDFLAHEAGRFVTTVLRLHEGAASWLLDGPFGPTTSSLQLRFDGTALLTPSGQIPLADLRLPGAVVAAPTR
ncbi:hypothetical protein [Kitasatospora sp. MBT63]|uniref:hypothetical protein n=1 Tax=Kitasatospora sp. MBT63 TaxID=1444768 RepID=UPI0011EA7044|nr:hypothetical protein [Kitasatospora sp. MBT63]